MRQLFKIFFIVSLLSLMNACFVPNTLNLRQGIVSFKAQDYRRAFIRLKPEAQKGQRDAQYAVGYMYYYGRGVVENRKKAWIWINLAAKAGQPDAIVALHMLEKGSFEKREVFQSKQLQHYPVNKEMY